MKRFSISLLITALVLMFAASAMAAPCTNMTRKVDSFDFLVDYSGSMMMKHAKLGVNKTELAKRILDRVNSQIPDLGYTAGLHTFAPVGTVLDLSPYSRFSMSRAIGMLNSNQEIFGRFTPMGQGMADLNPMFTKMPRKAAVILVTDGESNYGIDPVQQAKIVYASQPGFVFHVISLADNAEGQKIIDAIVALNPGSVSVPGASLLKDDAAVEKFAKDVFYNCGAAAEGIMLRSVQFAFDSSAITEESAVILDEVAKMIKGKSGKLEVAGHTCSIGTDQYNQGLSERRSASVKSYLVKKGVSADMLSTKGYGESMPKYDNGTEKGRVLNRRVELNELK